MIEYRKGNLLDVKEGIIAHGCNARGVMGSGVALAVKEKYPEAYRVYRQYCEDEPNILGHYMFVAVSPTLAIANLITQSSFGRDPNVRYVSYDAVDDAFKDLSQIAKNSNLTIHIPKIGAGLGNGDWNVISAIIESRCKDRKVICWEL